MTCTDSTGTGTPPGWYPDPEDSSRWRYWDGSQWAAPATPATASSPVTPPVATGLAGWVKLLVVAVAAALVAGAVWLSTRSESPGSTIVPEGDETPGTVVEADGDDAVRAGVEAIAQGASAFAGQYGHGPALEDALPGAAVSQFVDPWPTNPYTGLPMTQGSAPGDFTFNTAIDMPDGSYVGYVNGILGNGETYSVEFRY